MSDAVFWRGGNDSGDCRNTDLDPELDRIFELFSHPRRRALLYLLRDSDEGPLWTTNLAIKLARIEATGDDPHDAAEEIAVSLRHNHLPKLAEFGLIDADSSMTTFTYDGHDEIEALLQWTSPREDPLARFTTE